MRGWSRLALGVTFACVVGATLFVPVAWGPKEMAGWEYPGRVGWQWIWRHGEWPSQPILTLQQTGFPAGTTVHIHS